MPVGGPWLAIQGHDTVAHPCRDARRVGEQNLGQQLADLPGDVLIRAQEDAQQVTPAHDPDQPAVGIHHRKPPLEVTTSHQPRRRRERRIRMDGDGRRSQQLG